MSGCDELTLVAIDQLQSVVGSGERKMEKECRRVNKNKEDRQSGSHSDKGRKKEN